MEVTGFSSRIFLILCAVLHSCKGSITEQYNKRVLFSYFRRTCFCFWTPQKPVEQENYLTQLKKLLICIDITLFPRVVNCFSVFRKMQKTFAIFAKVGWNCFSVKSTNDQFLRNRSAVVETAWILFGNAVSC